MTQMRYLLVLLLALGVWAPVRGEITHPVTLSLAPAPVTTDDPGDAISTLSQELTTAATSTVCVAQRVLNPAHPISARILQGLSHFAGLAEGFEEIVHETPVNTYQMHRQLARMGQTLQFTAYHLRLLGFQPPPPPALVEKWNNMVAIWNRLMKTLHGGHCAK